MSEALTTAAAIILAQGSIAAGLERGLAPLAVVVLDPGGHDLVVIRSERASFYRVEIARVKAIGCLGMGMGGRAIAERAKAVPAFYSALAAITSHGVLPVPGGVLIRDSAGTLLGAVGISGDTADQDEAAALAGIAAAGLIADSGA